MLSNLFRFYSIFHESGYLFYWLIVSHVDACYSQLDTIIDVPGEIGENEIHTRLAEYRAARVKANRHKHKFFIVPFLAYSYLWAHSGYVIFRDGSHTADTMTDMFSRQIFPKTFWKQADIIVLCVATWCWFIYLNLIRKDFLNDRYCMFVIKDESGVEKLVVNGEIWNQENADKIIKFRKSAIKKMKYYMTISFVFAWCYFMWFYIGVEERNFKWWFDLFTMVFFISWYSQVGILFIFIYFFFDCRYILAKQAYLNKLLDGLVSTLQTELRTQKGFHFWRNHHEFMEINRKIAYQVTEIRNHNRFFSKHLTCDFLCMMIMICYLLYSLLFLEATMDQYAYFIWFLTEMIIFMNVGIYECSVVDSNNDRCYARNVKSCILFQLIYFFKPKNEINLTQTSALIQTISNNRNFSKYCFRLVNGYRLDSSAFNMAVGIVSTLFMKLAKNRHKANQLIPSD